jgi:hypothetical protein
MTGSELVTETTHEQLAKQRHTLARLRAIRHTMTAKEYRSRMLDAVLLPGLVDEQGLHLVKA